MNLLIDETVFVGFVIAWRFAGAPTSHSPVFDCATTDGVVRAPSEFAMTVGVFPSITATQEFVVPRSIPIIFPISHLSFAWIISSHYFPEACNRYAASQSDLKRNFRWLG
jgi:hypothetical protein